jgi:hypothetical protein
MQKPVKLTPVPMRDSGGVTLAELWRDCFGDDIAAHDRLKDMRTEDYVHFYGIVVYNGDEITRYGEPFFTAVHDVHQLLQKLDTHEMVRNPILDGLWHHLCIVHHG